MENIIYEDYTKFLLSLVMANVNEKIGREFYASENALEKLGAKTYKYDQIVDANNNIIFRLTTNLAYKKRTVTCFITYDSLSEKMAYSIKGPSKENVINCDTLDSLYALIETKLNKSPNGDA